MSVYKHLPNFLTLCNLLCGCAGLFLVARHDLLTAAYLIWLATLFDFADGLAARALRVYSELGKQLDSLADMISFGVLPAFIMLSLIRQFAPENLNYLAFTAFLIAVFSALRLAIFNIDTRQSHSFIGLPTPANALLISSFPIIISSDTGFLAAGLSQYYVLIALSVALSLLLVAPVELMALKFKSMRWKNNWLRYIFAAVSLILLALLQATAIPVIFVLYFIVSYLNRFTEAE